jgi:dienelactone hydrolase
VDQAVFLAQLGYVGVAVDLYQYPLAARNPEKGCSKADRVSHFVQAFDEMNRCLRDQPRFRTFMGLYLAQARAHAAAHPSLAGAIGYCFGGQCCLDMVRAGFDLQVRDPSRRPCAR